MTRAAVRTDPAVDANASARRFETADRAPGVSRRLRRTVLEWERAAGVVVEPSASPRTLAKVGCA